MVVYGETGNIAAAEVAGRDYASAGFDLSIAAITSLVTFHHPDDQTQFANALRLAGLPD
jgi:hypothetical protein